MARQRFVSTSEAASVLGVSEDTFEDLAAREDWCKPVHIGRLKRWDVADVRCLAHVVGRRALLNPRKKSPED